MTKNDILKKLFDCIERAQFDAEYEPEISFETDEYGDTFFDESGFFVLFNVNTGYRCSDFEKIQYKNFPDEPYSSYVKVTFKNDDWIEILNHEHRVYFNLYGCSSPQGIESMKKAVDNSYPKNSENTEIIDLYTGDRIKSGIKCKRGEKIPEGYFRLLAHICVFDGDRMLIQQKGKAKKDEDKWDITAGGGAMCGERSCEAASRELYEEVDITYFFSLDPPYLTLTYLDRIDDIYILSDYKVDIGKLNLYKDEVKAVKWATKEEILEMIDKGKFIAYNKNYIELLFFMNRNGRGCI